MPFEKINKYIVKNFPDWTVANLTGNNTTYSKGNKSSCIDHIIFNKAMSPHVHLSSACSFINGISDHNPIFLSCINNFSDEFIKPKKSSKWSKHICNTQNTNILSHNYFSVLANNLESKYDEISADDMVKEFINTANNIGKEIKVFVPDKLKGPAFHCPYYVKEISIAKHSAYENIKPFSDCISVDAYLDQFTQYHKLCKTLRKVKSALRSNRYKANIITVSNCFVNKEYRRGWRGLKKLSKPSYSPFNLHLIKSKSGQDLFTPKDQLERWAKH